MINQVTLVGRVSSGFYYDHESHGEKFYKFYLEIMRDSGYIDVIPIITSNRLVSVKKNLTGVDVCVIGQYRSFSLHKGEKNKLLLYVFANKISIDSAENDYNEILLEGSIVKPPINRETPQGRVITDVLLKVERGFGKSDYIPCIAWGRTAIYLSNFDIETKIRVTGRVQSRKYTKDNEVKTAYETSIQLMELVD